jgi:SAM-dependent methyltransferase
MLDYLKRLWLKFVVRYSDPQKYFNNRWRLDIHTDRWNSDLTKRYYEIIEELMKSNQCENFLDIGCGAWATLRDLPNYLGLDFSIEALMKSGLGEFIFADITKRIPLPSKSYDMVFTRSVLLHIPPHKIAEAVQEISRIGKKCIVLDEPEFEEGKKFQAHNFNHNLKELFKDFDGKVIFLRHLLADTIDSMNKT